MKTSPLIKYIFICGLTLTVATHVQAQTAATSSGDPAQVTENLKNRLKETINAVEADESPSTIGFIGMVKDIVKNTLVVEDKSGKRNIIVDDKTNILRTPGNTAIKLDSVRIGDAVIAMGVPDQSSSGETQGRRIIVSDTPFNPPSKATGLARITKLTATSLSVTSPTDSTSTTLSVTGKTVVKTPNETLDFVNLQEGDLVIYSALADPKDNTKLTATVIMKIKGQGPSEAPKVKPSPSAKSSASPKPSPKASAPGKTTPPPIY